MYLNDEIKSSFILTWLKTNSKIPKDTLHTFEYTIINIVNFLKYIKIRYIILFYIEETLVCRQRVR